MQTARQAAKNRSHKHFSPNSLMQWKLKEITLPYRHWSLQSALTNFQFSVKYKRSLKSQSFLKRAAGRLKKEAVNENRDGCTFGQNWIKIAFEIAFLCFLQVYEEKEKMWERELRKIKGLYDNRLRASQQKSSKMEQALTNQTYQVKNACRIHRYNRIARKKSGTFSDNRKFDSMNISYHKFIAYQFLKHDLDFCISTCFFPNSCFHEMFSMPMFPAFNNRCL